MLKPRAEWPDPDKPKATIVSELQAAMDDVPGNLPMLSQPIQQRMNETVAGIRTDVGVKIFGDDLDVLLWDAFSGNQALEKLLARHAERIAFAFCGHTHRAREGNLGPLRGYNLGGDYHFKRMLKRHTIESTVQASPMKP